MNEYKVVDVIKVYDADTVTLVLDLGFGITKKDKFRLSSINAPEVRGVEKPQGLVSRDWLREKLFTAEENGTPMVVLTKKDKKGKYGRYIAEIFVGGVSMNDALVTEGLAEYKEY